MKKILLDNIRNKIDEAEAELVKLKEAYRMLDENGTRNATFAVHICSSWEGENDIKIMERMTLQKLIQKTEAAFMTINHRSDVQGNYFVYIVLGELQVMVPDTLWREFTQKK